MTALANDPVPHLFLDVDGVCNRHKPFPNGYNGMDWENVQHLNWVVKETGCKIVVSSAWRYCVWSGSMNLKGLINLFLSHGIDCYGDVIVGITRRDISAEVTDRGEQIAEYVREHSVKRYAVVDDGGYEDPPHNTIWTDLGIRAAGHPVVFTDGKVGLTRLDAAKLIDILGGKT